MDTITNFDWNNSALLHTTIKLRDAFDASARITSGRLLNYIIMIDIAIISFVYSFVNRRYFKDEAIFNRRTRSMLSTHFVKKRNQWAITVVSTQNCKLRYTTTKCVSVWLQIKCDLNFINKARYCSAYIDKIQFWLWISWFRRRFKALVWVLHLRMFFHK